MKKVDTPKKKKLSLFFFQLTIIFDARRDFHVFLDFNINGNFLNLAHFDRSAEGLWP